MQDGRERVHMTTKRSVTQQRGGLGKDGKLELYRIMQTIRRFEEAAGAQYRRGNIRGFLHLYIGQEAIAAGAIPLLTDEDVIYTHYRDHGQAIARGLDLNAIMAELFGRQTGVSGGKGGSMHLFDPTKNFMGGYAIVAGHLPLATGHALALQYNEQRACVLCFLGDGALAQGEFHEALNLAAVWKLPIVFFVENNLYGMGAAVKEVFAASDAIYKIVEPYHVKSKQIDGMDVLAVRSEMEDVFEKVRSGGGPYFVEALTYRFQGHSIADPNEYRERVEEQKWRKRDPIAKLRAELIDEDGVSNDELDAIDAEVDRAVDESVEFASQSPQPPAEELYDDVIGGWESGEKR